MRAWLAGLLAAFGATPVTAAQPEPVKVWISTEPAAGGGEVFVGYAEADSALTVRYQLVGEKRGSGGHSSVSQGGQVAATPGKGKTMRLSQLSFGTLGDDDHYSIRLTLYDGEQRVGETVIQK